MKKLSFILLSLLYLALVPSSLFASGGVPEPASAGDTLLCIPRTAVNNTGSDASYPERYILVIQGPEQRDITLDAYSLNEYKTALKPGNYTATELKSVRVSDYTEVRSSSLSIPFTIRAGTITIFPARLRITLSTDTNGALTQTGELALLSSAEAKAELDSLRTIEGFAWKWDSRSYEVYSSARGATLKTPPSAATPAVSLPAQPSPSPSSPGASAVTTPAAPPIASIPDLSTIGILDITPKQGVSAMEADIVTDFVYDALYRYGGRRFMIISRQNRESILAEHQFSMTGFCDDASCALEVGRYLAADYVIIGSFTKFGTKYYLSLQLVDVNTTRVSGSAREGADDLDGIAAYAVDTCVEGIFR